MAAIENLLTQPQVHALGWTLLHFLWQGALVALALACSNLALGRSLARIRYAVNCAFLLVLLTLPVTTFIATLNSSPPGTPAAGLIEVSSPNAVFYLTPTAPVSESLEPFLPWLVGFWISGVALLSVHWMAAWAYVHRLRRAASLPVPPEWDRALQSLKERLSLSTPVRLCIHRLSRAPSVIGWLRPAILMPAAALTGLDSQALEAVLAHELAHIRRHDYLVNLLQAVVETLLFYHPAVWWVSNRIRVERENCCDDLAAHVCGDRVVYARALVDLEQIRSAPTSFALAANGGSLIERIQRLLRASETDQRRTPAWLSALVGLAAVAFIFAAARPAAHALGGAAKYSAAVSEQDTPATAPAPAPAGKPLRPTQRAPSAPQSGPPEESSDESRDNEDFIAGMAAAGFRSLSVDQLIDLRKHDVTPEFAREMKAAGFANIKPEQLIELRNHGVDAEFIKTMKENGLSNLSLDSLMTLAVHGVDADFIAEIKKAGLTGLSAEDYERLRIHGVDGDFIQGMKAAGLANLSLDELVSLRNHGVDPEFIAEMKSAGFTGLSAEDYRRLRMHGVDGGFIQGMKAAGLGNLSRDDLVNLRNHGVDPEFIAEIKGAGLSGLSAGDYERLRMHGVDGDFIHGMKAAGLGNLSLDELVSLRNHGVTQEFIADIKSAGFTGLSAEQYRQLRMHGVDAEFINHLKRHGFQNLSLDQVIRLKQAGL